MNKKSSQIIALFLCCILFFVAFSGCIENDQKSEEKILSVPEVKLDQPSVLPDWKDGEYHDYYETIDMLSDFKVKHPGLVNVFSIGKSVLGKDIWCIRITNEKNTKQKSSCLVTGCIHGCEWEGCDACLYLSEYLLINFDANETINHILNSSEVYIIPLVNPDGRQEDVRWNENGIDLNRNFDVDFGRLWGTSIPLGKLFGRIKIPYIDTTRLNKWFPKIIPSFLFNCGRRPFSEPETQAIRDFMMDLGDSDFSFYFEYHTAWHTFGGSWLVYKPPFEIPKQEQYVLDYVIDWVVENTEYEQEENNPNVIKLSGNLQDWCYKEFRIPSFGIEILTPDYDTYTGGGKHDHLVHWMKTVLPVPMYLLVNIDNLREWKTPDIQPSLPDDVPPEPLK